MPHETNVYEATEAAIDQAVELRRLAGLRGLRSAMPHVVFGQGDYRQELDLAAPPNSVNKSPLDIDDQPHYVTAGIPRDAAAGGLVQKPLATCPADRLLVVAELIAAGAVPEGLLELYADSTAIKLMGLISAIRKNQN